MSLEKKIEKGYFTFAMMKPDGMANGKAYYDFIGEIENQGLKIIYEEDILLNDDLLSKQYSHYADKPYYQVIIDYIKGVGDVITHIQEKEPKYKHEGNTAFIIYGENAIEKIRKILGDKDPEKADIGTIREKYGHRDESKDQMYNLIHASDSPEGFLREKNIYLTNLDLKKLIHKPVRPYYTN